MNTASIKDYIKFLRKKNNLTQQQVAESLLISPQAVSKWERGESLPDISSLRELADLLNTTVEEILAGGEKDITTEDVLKMITSFVDDNIFEFIFSDFLQATDVSELEIPLDVFFVLNDKQKSILTDAFLDLGGYANHLDKIIHYFNFEQQLLIIEKLLKDNDFYAIEKLLPFLMPNVKEVIADYFLEKENLEQLENVMPFLTSEQKLDLIEKIIFKKISSDKIENLLPFFNKSQRETLESYINMNS